MMRVIAGTARSLPLKTPAGMDTRPTSDKIKETIFNILNPYLADAVFLDLYSGTGGIGIEALSRGAKKAYFVESAAAAHRCIVENLKFTKMDGRAVVFRQDAIGAIGHIHEKEVHVVYMDPPYGTPEEKRALERLAQMPYVTKDTLIVVETALGTDFSYVEGLGFEVTREKRYKTNRHMFIRRQADAVAAPEVL